MREILFKAKRTDTREWVEGVPVVLSDGSKGTMVCSPRMGDDGYIVVDCVSIDPTTVCQYTGLIDKNNAKIFEGDILSDRYGNVGSVEYGDFNCGCCYDVYGYVVADGIDGLSDCSRILEIVGNIHDKEATP